MAQASKWVISSQATQEDKTNSCISHWVHQKSMAANKVLLSFSHLHYLNGIGIWLVVPFTACNAYLFLAVASGFFIIYFCE